MRSKPRVRHCCSLTVTSLSPNLPVTAVRPDGNVFAIEALHQRRAFSNDLLSNPALSAVGRACFLSWFARVSNMEPSQAPKVLILAERLRPASARGKFQYALIVSTKLAAHRCCTSGLQPLLWTGLTRSFGMRGMRRCTILIHN